MECFHAGLNGRKLAAALTANAQSLVLDGVPADLAGGRYPFKVDLEVLSGSYPGSGVTFGDLERGLDGTTPRAHLVTTRIGHPIRGVTLAALARLSQPQPHIRSAAERIFLYQNFS